MPRLLAIIVSLTCLSATSAADPPARVPRLNPAAPTSAYVNGLWYESDGDGIRFVAGDRYSIAGVFTATGPEAIDRTIDLAGGFAIPPLGEAHNHSVDGPATARTAARYLEAGIFSYKNPNNIASVAAEGASLFNRPSGLDIAFAHGGLSVRGGHPEGLYRHLARYNGMDPERLDGRAFFDVPSPEALARRWPEILANRPDFLKLYLLDASAQGGGKAPQGLSAGTFRRAVTLATEAGLRTTVHIETAADLALAVDAGATECAHLPGYAWAPTLGADAYRISDDLARKMADRRFIVVTTTIVTEGRPPADPAEADRRRLIQGLQVANLQTLHRLGVPLAIGADSYALTALDEALHLRKLGAFTDPDLLRLCIETAPISIFPGRAIGRIAPGHEASFLVLEANPLEDFARIKQIKARVKQGLVLD